MTGNSDTLISITNGSDDRLHKAIGKALLRFHVANRADLDAVTIASAAGVHLVDAAWHVFRGITDPPITPDLFGELMRQLGESVARGEHLPTSEVMQ